METKRKRNDILKGQLDYERSSFLSHWRDLGDNILPRRPRFFVSDTNRGERRNTKIIDSTATVAARTLRSGMMSGVTSPARPWFRLTTPDAELAEFGKVKTWLHDVGERINSVYLRSNLYNILPITYGDMGVFATAAQAIEEDFTGKVIHNSSFPIGSYSIGKGANGKVNTFARDFRMTVRQLVEMFGTYDGATGKADWSKFSSYVKSAWDRSEYETWIEVRNVIQPNIEYDPRKLESRYKKFSSDYYESGSIGSGSYISSPEEDRYLSEKGYDYFPILVPRWEVTGEDVWGTDCPGMTALGDIKQLQVGEKRGAQALDKMVNPPMVGPTSLRNAKATILPGDMTFVDVREGMQGFRAAHDTNLRLSELENKQDQIRRRIDEAFFANLFLMLANDSRSGITAREIEERHEEKLLALGPVLEQLNQDLLDPLIDNTFDIMVRQRLLPDPPDELKGVALRVEYVSVMAQAQKLVGISGLERFARFVEAVVGVHPDAIDKVDTDQMVDDYSDAVGISPKIVRSDEDTAALRQQKAQAQQAAQRAEMLQQGAGAARDLSQADLGGDNALSRLIQNAQAGQIVPSQ